MRKTLSVEQNKLRKAYQREGIPNIVSFGIGYGLLVEYEHFAKIICIWAALTSYAIQVLQFNTSPTHYTASLCLTTVAVRSILK